MQKKIIYIQGPFDQEITFDMRRLFPEECWLAAVINFPVASQYVFDCLMLQEHRWEKSAWIISCHKWEFYHRKRMWKIRQQFVNVEFEKELPWSIAIWHNRYATTWSHDSITNIQPLFFHDTKYWPFAIAHNGNIPNAQIIKKELIEKWALFQSTTDSEIFGHFIVQSQEENIEDAIVSMARKIPMAYSLLIFTTAKLIALRDRFGVRPLDIWKMDGWYVICSENHTFNQYPECKFLRSIKAGEMIVFNKYNEEFQSIQYANPIEHFCIFEWIYFSNPRTKYNWVFHEDFREELGAQIYRENPDLKADYVIPILDSWKHAALWLANAMNIPYREYFLRIHNPPRTNNRSFIAATQEDRIKAAYQKLHLKEEKIKGKNIITVDDSIVRWTTTKIINKRLKEAWAKSITNCVSSPAITNICNLGMDFSTTDQLIAYESSIDQIAKKIDADKLIYLSLDWLKLIVDQTYKCGICCWCFGWCYPKDKTLFNPNNSL